MRPSAIAFSSDSEKVHRWKEVETQRALMIKQVTDKNKEMSLSLDPQVWI
jgi:hypothetical protein